MPLNQIAGVSVPEASMLVITPFDKKAIKAIETAILKSELGLNPGQRRRRSSACPSRPSTRNGAGN